MRGLHSPRLLAPLFAALATLCLSAPAARAQCDPPTVTITSPLAGEHVNRGGWFPMTWTTTGTVFDPVIVGFRFNEGAAWSIMYPPNTGETYWGFGGCPVSTDCFVAITVSGGACGASWDLSGPFELNTSLSDLGVALTAPLGGESYLENSPSFISWTTSGPAPPTVGLEFSADAGASWSFITPVLTDNDGRFDWLVPGPPTDHARIRITATNACTNQPVVATSGDFRIVATCDDGRDCTFDFFYEPAGQCVHFPFFCNECDHGPDTCGPGLVCVNHLCVLRNEICGQRNFCFYNYFDPQIRRCRAVFLCPFGYCCQDGRCIPGPCGSDEIDVGLVNAFTYLQNAGLQGAILHLFTHSPGVAFGPYAFASNAGLIVFDYQLVDPAPNEVATLSFGDRLLWRADASAPAGEWTQAVAYVGDLAGQAGVLTLALGSGDVDPPDDELLVRDMRLLSTGRDLCAGDADLNGLVDLSDLTLMLSHFGTQTGATWSAGDFDADGDVDINDLTLLLSNFGSICL